MLLRWSESLEKKVHVICLDWRVFFLFMRGSYAELPKFSRLEPFGWQVGCRHLACFPGLPKKKHGWRLKSLALRYTCMKKGPLVVQGMGLYYPVMWALQDAIVYNSTNNVQEINLRRFLTSIPETPQPRRRPLEPQCLGLSWLLQISQVVGWFMSWLVGHPWNWGSKLPGGWRKSRWENPKKKGLRVAPLFSG